MAKLAGPLFSIRANGKIADTLVYFGWKGLKVVRSYVIPSNPQSTGQTTQRGYLTDAVAMIHQLMGMAANGLDEEDQIAYAALGSIRATPRTWFNEAVKLWLDCKVAGDTPVVYRAASVTDTTRNSVDINIKMNQETPGTMAAVTFYLGKSKTNLVHGIAGAVTDVNNIDLAAADISGWTAVGDKIYYQARPDAGDGCEGADTGIYYFVAT